MTKCYQCTHADFKTPISKQMGGFCHCNIKREPWKYLPSCQVCETGKFQTASSEVIERRKRFFEQNGKDVRGLE
ncbi:hypothetical protein LVJ85_05655 [Neisseria sp. Dent CA1/247]|uniref:hypothetical protein n=1 Tax=Neisseria sp. Dent CA1/247 TaxID=2912675 RepID=UPI001FD21A72|nr:hypothetical protein [Neisseria sp. Dent CA1/247]UOO77947.1 hypothetical protein LVJ85_05655 [Neisseria sp. Dent CA1/247]